MFRLCSSDLELEINFTKTQINLFSLPVPNDPNRYVKSTQGHGIGLEYKAGNRCTFSLTIKSYMFKQSEKTLPNKNKKMIIINFLIIQFSIRFFGFR